MAFRRIKQDHSTELGSTPQNTTGLNGSNQHTAPTQGTSRPNSSMPHTHPVERSPTGGKAHDRVVTSNTTQKPRKAASTKTITARHGHGLNRPRMKLDKVKRSVLNFNNHALTLDYNSPALASLKITKLSVLPGQMPHLDVPMHVVKFKANEQILGAAVFNAALMDDLLDHPISHDFFNIPHNYQRAIMEEIRRQLVEQFDLIEDLHFADDVYSLYEFITQKMAKKALKIKAVSVHFELKGAHHHFYIVCNKTTYDLIHQMLLAQPQRQNLVVPRNAIKYWATLGFSDIHLTQAEFDKLQCGTVLFLSLPKHNNYFKLRTTQGVWQGCVEQINTVKLEGKLPMDNGAEKVDTPSVEISIDLGGKHISLDELEKLVAGYVIDTGQTIDKNYPLMANNIKVGTCHLTDIEGNIGLQIVSIDQALLKQ